MLNNWIWAWFLGGFLSGYFISACFLLHIFLKILIEERRFKKYCNDAKQNSSGNLPDR